MESWHLRRFDSSRILRKREQFDRFYRRRTLIAGLKCQWFWKWRLLIFFLCYFCCFIWHARYKLILLPSTRVNTSLVPEIIDTLLSIFYLLDVTSRERVCSSTSVLIMSSLEVTHSLRLLILRVKHLTPVIHWERNWIEDVLLRSVPWFSAPYYRVGVLLLVAYGGMHSRMIIA